MHRVEQIPASRTRIHLILAAVAVLMFGFAFALVPLYDTLCRVLDINGKIEQVKINAAEVSAITSVARDIRVQMVTSNSEKVGWSFYPLVGAMKVHPGEIHKVQFHAKNKTDRPMTVRAIPSITPSIGARYLVKTDCFCFQKQTLQAGESVKMPLAFYVSPDLPNQYRTLTLSYALFETERQ
jgi:cytochrome c oxidase assembly protein subunit 11